MEVIARPGDYRGVEKVKVGPVKRGHGGCIGCTWARGGGSLMVFTVGAEEGDDGQGLGDLAAMEMAKREVVAAGVGISPAVVWFGGELSMTQGC